MHGTLNPTLKEGAHHMKRLSLFALAVALVLAISAWAPAPVAAQTPVQRGRTLDLLFYSSAGTTTLRSAPPIRSASSSTGRWGTLARLGPARSAWAAGTGFRSDRRD